MSASKHTNRLIQETSPYLLQHAHNPVDWQPWGEAAFEQAKTEDKPILLSVGYSACHWCHVMERESFENEEIAQLMNDLFINIKVDREERPDVDQIYMNAVQAMTGHGGWPMTVFLTPQGEPFYGGTYFPPVERHNLPAFPRVLLSIAEFYRARREEVKQSAAELVQHLRSLDSFKASTNVLTVELFDNAVGQVARNFDSTLGGFGRAPKFPPAQMLMFLLRQHQRNGNQAALEMVILTLDKMAQGGIYDQLGGGFHRYSTDERWLAPHFEKMLYDNALLARIYLYAYQVTGKLFYRRIVEQTIDYVLREMTDAKGGFYSAQDADSEGHEGKFFVWTPQEIDEALAEEDGRLFKRYYDVTEAGNFEGKNILHLSQTSEVAARKLNVSFERFNDAIERSRQKLFDRREQRIKPGRDEKILTAWNGLMLTALAEVAAALNRDDYRQAAVKNAEFVLTHLKRNGRLLRSYKDNQAKFNAYLEDYAYFIEGLLALYQATFDVRWFVEARALADTMLEQFWDDEKGGFFFTGRDHETLITRTKDFMDNATPAGNSSAAQGLLRLGLLTGEAKYQQKALALFQILRDAAEKYPSAFGYLMSAMDFYLSKPKEIAIIGNLEAEDTKALIAAAQSRYLPNCVIAQAAPDDVETVSIIPLLANRTQVEGKATAYICRNFSCQLPVTTSEDLLKQLAE